MNNFTYTSATDTNSALKLLSESPDRNAARFLAGGTNLVDLMREGIETPEHVVDVSRLSTGIESLPDGGLRIGALVNNTDLAYPALTDHPEALLSIDNPLLLVYSLHLRQV